MQFPLLSLPVKTCSGKISLLHYRNKYGEFTKIRTDTIELPSRGPRYGNWNRYDNGPPLVIKKPKITIIMKRTPDFFKNMEEFERIREEAIKQEEQEMAKKDEEQEMAKKDEEQVNSQEAKPVQE